MTTLEIHSADDSHEASAVQAKSVHEPASKGNWDDFDRIKARVQDAPPAPGDER
jgi:hypothetical protein